MPRSPKAEVEITASSRTLAAKLREARAKFSNFGQELKKNIFGKDLVEKGFWGKAGAQMVGNLGSRAASGLGELLVDQGKEVFRFNDALTRFGIAARKTPEEMQAIARSVREVSNETGISADEVLRAGRAYIDLAGAGAYTNDMMSLIARAAQASGTEISDLTTVVYALHNSLKIPDNEMEATLSGLINQSKDGTVHFNQLAQEIIGIAPDFARFGLAGREGANELAAMFQVVRGGSKDAAETSTKLESFMKGLMRHEKNFKKFGIKLTDVGPDGVKHWRQLSTIIKEIQGSKLGKDAGKLMSALGRGEGESAFNLLTKNIDKLKEFEEAAKQSDTIQKDMATYGASAAGRLSIAWEHAKNAIADAMTPERIDRFVGAMENLLPKLAKMAGWITDAADWIDHIVNGPSSSEAAKDAGADFMEAAQTGGAAREDAIRQAKMAVDNPNSDVVDAIGEGHYGNLEGYVAAAKQFLKQQGMKGGDPWATPNAQPMMMAPITRADIAKAKLATPEAKLQAARETGEAIAAAIAKVLAPLLPRLEKAAKTPVHVKVGNDAIVTAHRDAPIHRTRPGG